jgi:hypothetical protein
MSELIYGIDQIMTTEILTLIVLLLTLGAIVWYSWEIRELRKWQKRQAQLSVIHMEMNRVIGEHANGPERSPGVLLRRWEIAQRKIIQGEDINMKDLFYTNKTP